jgi:hypothetical protein
VGWMADSLSRIAVFRNEFANKNTERSAGPNGVLQKPGSSKVSDRLRTRNPKKAQFRENPLMRCDFRPRAESHFGSALDFCMVKSGTDWKRHAFQNTYINPNADRYAYDIS